MGNFRFASGGKLRRLRAHFLRIKMNKPKVLVADPVSERGIAELQEGGLLDVTVKTGMKEDELLQIIGEFDGLVVRSQTKVNEKVIEAAKNLKVIVDAGLAHEELAHDALCMLALLPAKLRHTV